MAGSGSNRSVNVESALAQALRQFGELSLDGGLLAQVWMPGSAKAEGDGGGKLLQTKGLPYSILGPGDMLAIFRCLSCKYSFSADLNRQDAMGAPGRVYVSGEAETSDNVQGYKNSIYLRAKDAEACRVSATLLLPIYATPERDKAAAVLEVTQFNNSGITYRTVFEWAKLAMESVSLYTPAHIQTKTFEMQSHALSIRFFSSRNSALGTFFGLSSESGLLHSMELPAASMMQPGAKAVSSAPKVKVADGGPRGERASDDFGDDAGESPSMTAGVDREKGSGKAALTKADLEKHFGYGLKEAAQRLGVCNTTLKRACRRHGIMKWPRRDLLRAARKQQSMEQEAAMPDLGVLPSQIQSSPSAQDLHASASGQNLQALPSASAAMPPPQEPNPFGSIREQPTQVMAFPAGYGIIGQQQPNFTLGSSPTDFSFLGTNPETPLSQNVPRQQGSASFGTSATASLPSSGFMDRSCSSSLDAPKGFEGTITGVRDPLRQAIQRPYRDATNPGSSVLLPNQEAPESLAQLQTERFNSLGIGDPLNFLGSFGREMQDFGNILGSGNSFEWENTFNEPEFSPKKSPHG